MAELLPIDGAPSGVWWAAALLASYLLGSVPFGWLMARLFRGVDLRTVGSGNIGATNAMRALGKPFGVAAFLLDFGKGYVPVAFFAAGDPRLRVACGAAAICGHVWPIYLRFRGGKAVATSFGAITAVDPLVALGGGATWLGVLYLCRYVSIASIATGVAFAVLAALRAPSQDYGSEFVLATSALAVLILARHRPNILRILAREEPKTKLFARAREGSRG